MILLMRLILRSKIASIIVSVLLLIGGLIYGLTSHTVNYLPAPQGPFQSHSLTDGSYLFQEEGSQTYFIINPSDFTPTVNDSAFADATNGIDFLYKNASESVSFTSKAGNHVSGTGYRIEKLMIGNSSGTTATFLNKEYIQNPNGAYDNNWGSGGVAIALGLLLLLFIVLLPIINGKKAQRGLDSVDIYNSRPQSFAPNAYVPPTTPVGPNPYAPAPNPYTPAPNPYAPAPNPYAQQGYSEQGAPAYPNPYGPSQPPFPPNA